jgi:hypothetical protein
LKSFQGRSNNNALHPICTPGSLKNQFEKKEYTGFEAENQRAAFFRRSNPFARKIKEFACSLFYGQFPFTHTHSLQDNYASL